MAFETLINKLGKWQCPCLSRKLTIAVWPLLYWSKCSEWFRIRNKCQHTQYCRVNFPLQGSRVGSPEVWMPLVSSREQYSVSRFTARSTILFLTCFAFLNATLKWGSHLIGCRRRVQIFPLSPENPNKRPALPFVRYKPLTLTMATGTLGQSSFEDGHKPVPSFTKYKLRPSNLSSGNTFVL